MKKNGKNTNVLSGLLRVLIMGKENIFKANPSPIRHCPFEVIKIEIRAKIKNISEIFLIFLSDIRSKKIRPKEPNKKIME